MIKDINYENLKIGDILYEFYYNLYIKSEVVEEPIIIKSEHSGKQVSWKSRNVLTGEIIDYLVSLDLLHYGPKLYTYEAYVGCKQV